MECNADRGGVGNGGVVRLVVGRRGGLRGAGLLGLVMPLVMPSRLASRWVFRLAPRLALSLTFSVALGLTMGLGAEGSLGKRTLPVPGGWTRVQTAGMAEQLICTYQVATFVESVALVERMVAPAEALGHHPDVEIRYNRVRLSLTTHDAGGLTDLDVRLARAISAIASRQSPPLRCLEPELR